MNFLLTTRPTHHKATSVSQEECGVGNHTVMTTEEQLFSNILALVTKCHTRFSSELFGSIKNHKLKYEFVVTVLHVIV